MKKRRFKFLRTGLKSDYNGFQWEIGKWHKTECLEICYGFNCSEKILDALSYVKGEILAEVEVRGKKFVGSDKSTHAGMRIIKAWNWTKKDSVALAVFSAESVIGIFEKKFPKDDRPRKAIEAARKYLEHPTEKNARAAARAAAGAAGAAGAAAGAAGAAARAAGAAARAAGAAAGDAARAAGAAAGDAWAAAGDAARDALLDTINIWLIEHLKDMEGQCQQ